MLVHETVVRATQSGMGAAAVIVTAEPGSGGGSGDDLATTGDGLPWGAAVGGLVILLMGLPGRS